MSMILLVMTDGRRECIERSIPAALEHLHGLDLAGIVISDDSGDSHYAAWLWARFDGKAAIYSSRRRSGYAKAVIRARGHAILAADIAGAEHVFWLEDDFILQRPVDLAAMAQVLAEERHLSQLLLKRQAWFANEVAAGGIIEYAPDNFFDAHNDRGDHWVEYDAFWANPHLVNVDFLRAHPWPQVRHSEAVYSGQMKQLGRRGAFWGKRDDPPLVEHVGVRQGKGY